MKKTGIRRGFKSFTAALAAFLLAASLPVTALADGEFSGNIIIRNVVPGYEYKVYEVLDCIAAGGESSVFMATDEWKDFLETNENAVAMLTPSDYDNSMADEDSRVYTVNMESDKAVRQAFAEDVLQYARENQIEPTEIITAQDGDSEVAFMYLMLGIHVVDTAGRARVVVMWDMGWESDIKESYQPEDKAADSGTGASDIGEEPSEAGGEAADTGEEPEQKDELQKAAGQSEEESGAGESPLPAEEETRKGGSAVPVIIAAAAVPAIVLFTYRSVKRKRASKAAHAPRDKQGESPLLD